MVLGGCFNRAPILLMWTAGRRGFMRHELKVWPEYFEPVAGGWKRFELRKDDRGFKVGDAVVLKEWDPESGYSG